MTAVLAFNVPSHPHSQHCTLCSYSGRLRPPAFLSLRVVLTRGVGRGCVLVPTQTLIAQTHCFPSPFCPFCRFFPPQFHSLYPQLQFHVPLTNALPYSIKAVPPTAFKIHESNSAVLQLPQTPSTWSHH